MRFDRGPGRASHAQRTGITPKRERSPTPSTSATNSGIPFSKRPRRATFQSTMAEQLIASNTHQGPHSPAPTLSPTRDSIVVVGDESEDSEDSDIQPIARPAPQKSLFLAEKPQKAMPRPMNHYPRKHGIWQQLRHLEEENEALKTQDQNNSYALKAALRQVDELDKVVIKKNARLAMLEPELGAERQVTAKLKSELEVLKKDNTTLAQDVLTLADRLKNDSKNISEQKTHTQGDCADNVHFLVELEAILAPLEGLFTACSSSPKFMGTNDSHGMIQLEPFTPQKTETGGMMSEKSPSKNAESPKDINVGKEHVPKETPRRGQFRGTSHQYLEHLRRITSNAVITAGQMEEHLLGMKTRLATVQAESEQSEQEKIQLQHKVADLESRLTSLDALQADNLHNSEFLGQRAVEVNKQLQNKIDALQDQLKGAEDRSRMLQAQRDSMIDDFGRAGEENVQLCGKVSDIEKRLQATEAAKTLLEIEKFKALDETKAKLASCSKQLQGVEAAKAALEAVSRKAVDQEEELRKQITVLLGDLATSQEVTINVQDKRDELQVQCDEIAKQKDSLQKELGKMSNDLESTRKQLREAEKGRNFFKGESKIRAEQNQQLQQQLGDAQHALETTRKQLKDAKTKWNNVEAKQQSNAKREEDKVKQLQEQLDEMQHTLETTRKQLKGAEAKWTTLMAERQLESKAEQDKVKQLQGQLDEAQRTNDTTREQLRNAEAEQNALKAKQQCDARSDEEKVKRLQDQLAEVQKALTVSEESLKTTEDQKQVLLVEGQKYARERTRLQMAVDAMKVALDDANSVLGKVKEKLQMFKSENQALKEDLWEGYRAAMYAGFGS